MTFAIKTFAIKIKKNKKNYSQAKHPESLLPLVNLQIFLLFFHFFFVVNF